MFRTDGDTDIWDQIWSHETSEDICSVLCFTFCLFCFLKTVNLKVYGVLNHMPLCIHQGSWDAQVCTILDVSAAGSVQLYPNKQSFKVNGLQLSTDFHSFI